MATATIKGNKVLRTTAQAFQDGSEVVIHRGGTGSGKTFDIIQFLIVTAAGNTNKVITTVSESRPHLEIGAIRILQNVMKQHGLWEQERWNISKSVYQFASGSVIEFFSADRIDKALGARRDWLYGNEINSLKKDVWDELARRSENVIADFNPTAQFWLEDWIENYDRAKVIKSNYLDNPDLPEHERARIAKRAARDQNFRRIHIDCEYGIFEGLVFTDWQQVDEVPEGRVKFGLDFGFTNDPTALVKVVETGEALYADELIYRTGLHNRELAALMAEVGLTKNYDEVFADSAEPKTIDELRLAGFNVKKAEKPQGSVNAGIDKLKSRPLYITKRSVNLIRELRNYSWVADKNGQPTNKPVDAFNHAIDAMRYAISVKKLENWTI